jgi:hypothetical protein
MNVAVSELVQCYQHKCRCLWPPSIAFKVRYMLIQRAELSWFADDMSSCTLYWHWQLSELENGYEVMLMNYSSSSPYGFALRTYSSWGYDVITDSKIDIYKCDQVIKNCISIEHVVSCVGWSNVSQKQEFQNSVMTFVWHLCRLYWWFVLCGVWSVCGLLIVRRFLKVLEDVKFFMLGWPCSLNYMNNNQHNALFIFSLLSYHTSTCFRHISSPSTGGTMYICGKWYLLYGTVDCQLTVW